MAFPPKRVRAKRLLRRALVVATLIALAAMSPAAASFSFAHSTRSSQDLDLDSDAPVVSDVATVPEPVNHPGSVDLTALADDSGTGDSDIVSADFQLDGGPWSPMGAADGSYDSPSEQADATIESLGIGSHDVCVRATDAGANTSDGTDCTIADVLAEPAVSIGMPAPVTEGDIGTTDGDVSVTPSSSSTEPMDVHWSTSDGSATAGADYLAASGTLHWDAGDGSVKTIQVPVQGDTLHENDETFAVTLDSPVNASIEGSPSSVVTILDDDPQTSDFNGDGFADLAIGVPRENPDKVKDAGMTDVVYGSPSGLSPATMQRWWEGAPGVAGDPEPSDLSGYTIATGDLNGDGFADLAIGSPFEDVGSVDNAGAVTVVFGSPSGLQASGSEQVDESSPGVPDDPEVRDQFGYALAIADIDGDGYGDLAVGVQREGFANAQRSGSVIVLRGSPDGLSTVGAQQVAPALDSQLGPAQSGAAFGSAVAVGDLNGDGFADLLVGTPFGDVGGVRDAGEVDVIPGSPAGLRLSKAKVWTQDSKGVLDQGEVDDEFGWRVASGDLNGDGIDDAIVGVPKEDLLGNTANAGAVQVLFGSHQGVKAKANQFLSENTPQVPGVAHGGEQLGTSLAVGDLNGDGRPDLIAGAKYDSDLAQESGAVYTFFGSPSGPSAAGSQVWTQATPGVPDDPEPFDHLGNAVAAGRFGQGPADDLVIGVQFEDLSDSLVHAGVIHILPGTGQGPTGTGSILWRQADLTGETTAAYNYFPFALAAS